MPKFLTKKFIINAIRFVVYFLAVAITPYFAKPIAPHFDWVGYGFMRPMFVEVFTMIIWAIEAIIIALIELILRKKGITESPKKKIFVDEDEPSVNEEVSEKTAEEGASVAESSAEETHVAESSAEETSVAEKTKKKKKKRKKFSIKQWQNPLPLLNVAILTAITVVCVLIVSIIIEFQVKLFYDLGENITGHDLYLSISKIGRNAVKCFWLVAILHASAEMMGEVFKNIRFKWDKIVYWICVGALVMLFGLHDVFTSIYGDTHTRHAVAMTVTYLFFYVAFTAIYALTKKHKVKSYLLIAFIYLF